MLGGEERQRGKEGGNGREGGRRRDLVSLSHWVPRALLCIVALE